MEFKWKIISLAKIRTGDSCNSKQPLYQLSYRNLVALEGGKFWYIAADLGPVLVDTCLKQETYEEFSGINWKSKRLSEAGLTNNSQVEYNATRWRRRHLALVVAGVRVADVPDSKLPEVRHGHVVGREPLIRGVGVPTDGQQADVVVTDPGYLKQSHQRCSLTPV